MNELRIHQAGPGLTVQDLGRPGWSARGLSTGGAVDRLALMEAAALCDVPAENAVVEMMGFGGTFSVTEATRFALTGADMAASIDGSAVLANITYLLEAGQMLTVGGARRGVFGYLAFAGGIATPAIMGSRAAHLTAGLGEMLSAGQTLPLGPDQDPQAAQMCLSVESRLGSGTIRVMPGPQTGFFSAQTLARFAATDFVRSPRGNRQGVRMDSADGAFTMDGAPNIASDLIVPGDVQMTGDGVPYVLLAECQTTGGYPRIGTVIPADLPKVAQALPGDVFRFEWITVEEAEATVQSQSEQMQKLYSRRTPRVRDPHDIPDLLRYQLISGVTAGDDLEGA